jgi:transcriptional regulator with XRE-family HTH domain
MSDQQVSPDSTVPAWTLGWRLQRALAAAGISTDQMARELGVHRATVSRWMNDRGAPPRPGIVRAWAAICRVSYQWLATGETADTLVVPSSRWTTGSADNPSWVCLAAA